MSPARTLSALLASAAILLPGGASAGEGAFGWMSGNWYLTVGATGLVAPKFEGSSRYMLSAVPLVSLGKAGNDVRFSSRNDNISLALVDSGDVRVGLVGKFLWARDNDAAELKGLDPVRWGGEVGGFFEIYPFDWMRVRAELRHGIRAHHGFAGDVAADVFYDVTPDIRVSAGPRLSFASAKYFDAYYGVDAQEAIASNLAEYRPGSGLKSAGVGGAVTWKVTNPVTASLFGEYARLTGPAAKSSLVRERGSRDQFTVGISTTYRFDFSM